METKVCTKCNEEKKLIEFYTNKRNNGYRSVCKKCSSAEYHLNKPKSKKIVIETNIIKICGKCKIEKKATEFFTRSDSSDGYRNYCKKCHDMGHDTYYDINREDMTKICKKCDIKKNISEFDIDRWKDKEYYRGSCKKCENKRKNYYITQMTNTNTLFKLKRYTRALIRMSIKNSGYTKKSRTFQILGCSFEEFRSYIESKFEPWMNWENHGGYTGNYNETWQLDHIIPISSATTEEDVIQLNHFNNLQPLCSRINQVDKNDKI